MLLNHNKQSVVTDTQKLQYLGRNVRSEWMNENGLKLSDKRPHCIHFLTNVTGRCAKCMHVSPWLDHGELYTKKRKSEVLIGHPYILNPEHIEDIETKCRELDLDFEISTVSWYFPGHTYSVKITRKRDYREMIEKVRVIW